MRLSVPVAVVFVVLLFAPSDALKKFTKAQVARHNKPSDLWVIVHGKVYDLTDFAPQHPGGQDVLEAQAGKDATDLFEEIGHDADARHILSQYIVGQLVCLPHPCHVSE